MSVLHLPLDYERLPEYRQFVLSAGSEETASFRFNRLWVELGYQAGVTRRTGLLSARAAKLYGFPVEPLVESGWLRALGEEGWMCDRFADLNGHLSPDYKSPQARGNDRSALVRGHKRIAHEASQLSLMLAPDLFKRRDGTPIHQSDILRIMVLIKTLDNCLKRPQRDLSSITAGLIADAAAVIDRHSPDQLDLAYNTVLDHRDHPAMPETTELLLATFHQVLAALARTGN